MALPIFQTPLGVGLRRCCTDGVSENDSLLHTQLLEKLFAAAMPLARLVVKYSAPFATSKVANDAVVQKGILEHLQMDAADFFAAVGRGVKYVRCQRVLGKKGHYRT